MRPRDSDPQMLATALFAELCGGRRPSMDLFRRRVYTDCNRTLRTYAWAPADGELPVTCLTIEGTDHVFTRRTPACLTSTTSCFVK